jgi:glycosyltransferase involved in cell wall biosynthesis
MRLLALTNIYPSPVFPTRGSFNRHPLRLLGKRHAVRVIVPIGWTDEWQAKRRGEVKFPKHRREELDGLIVDYPRYWFPPRILRAWYGHFFLRSVRGTFRRAVEEFRPDAVLASWAYPDGWAGVRLAREARLPVVVKVHGSDVKLLDKYPARRLRTAEALKAAAGVIAVSQDLVEHVLKLGVDAQKVRLIYNGVDATVFRPGSKDEARDQLGVTGDSPLLLFVGNLFPVKGPDLLLSAFATLIAQGVSARLAIIGQGHLRESLERQAADLGIENLVTFIGPLPQEQLVRWYRAADLLVLPSRSEGVPNVLLEASACGCPWVASSVGGVPEIAHFGHSRLVLSENPAELARGISEMLGHTENTAVSPRSWDAAVNELEELLLTVAGQPVAAVA